ncbi:MAG: DUF2238 domain-containing protein [Candidatus Hydrogenedentes bacterium]|nr:DUF2238 domain-containing protein [Candidatus Hydrogenedentota bacterium]
MSSIEAKQPLLTRDVQIVLAFTLAYLAVAVAGALRTGNAEFIIYIGVMVVLVGVIGFVHYRVNLTLPALWALTGWGAAHMAGGLVTVPESWPIHGDIRVLYSLWLIPERLKYDQVIHAYGFGVTTWVCWQGLRSVLLQYGPARPTYGLMVLCAAGGMGFGALNEVIEFTATLLVPETNVGGYVNTGWDLVANLTGTTIAATLIVLTGRGSGPATE